MYFAAEVLMCLTLGCCPRLHWGIYGTYTVLSPSPKSRKLWIPEHISPQGTMDLYDKGTARSRLEGVSRKWPSWWTVASHAVSTGISEHMRRGGGTPKGGRSVGCFCAGRITGVRRLQGESWKERLRFVSSGLFIFRGHNTECRLALPSWFLVEPF